VCCPMQLERARWVKIESALRKSISKISITPIFVDFMTTGIDELPEKTGDVKIEYYNAYFGVDSYYYIPLMIDFDNGKKFRFNGWAFWGGMFWLIYRRQFKPMLVIFAILLFIEFIKQGIISFFSLSKNIDLVIHYSLTLIFALSMGYLGNYFIMQRAKKKTMEILANNEDEDIILQKLEKTGSGNKKGVFITIAIFIALIVLNLILKSQL